MEDSGFWLERVADVKADGQDTGHGEKSGDKRKHKCPNVSAFFTMKTDKKGQGDLLVTFPNWKDPFLTDCVVSSRVLCR